ncbi:hypothetical protein PVK06_013467 [Gossypium arboreum]|uniref:Uncharacterized protein n=1 Tax=Gossypium arboreum TaxID=29729 RepID=A0ABR0PRS3_GOSAR|nr:hypothetical protein PVK06_013467 [Gossypium arboreum]
MVCWKCVELVVSVAGFMFCSELWIADQGYGLLALETVPMWMWLSYFTLKFGKTQYKDIPVCGMALTMLMYFMLVC